MMLTWKLYSVLDRLVNITFLESGAEFKSAKVIEKLPFEIALEKMELLSRHVGIAISVDSYKHRLKLKPSERKTTKSFEIDRSDCSWKMTSRTGENPLQTDHHGDLTNGASLKEFLDLMDYYLKI